jgi:hypothetical protein
MDFRVHKEKLLKVLRSDITGIELRTGHGNPSLLDNNSNETDSRPTSPESYDDAVVYTHEVCNFRIYHCFGRDVDAGQYTGYVVLRNEAIGDPATDQYHM